MYKTKAYSAISATSPMASTTIPRRGPKEHNVQLEIRFCGICHSDLYTKRLVQADVEVPLLDRYAYLKSE